jgi:alpha-glucosidase (family GH31 glycosyl hydrolase)
MHSDLGGFAGDNLDDELYVRWLQYGVFQPIFRPHAQEEVPSEPVFRSEWAKKHSKQAIDLRYRLLPYNYNLAIQNATTGFPLMRPLFFEEPDNKKLYENDKGYLWGNDFLVYPIKDKSLAQMDVYFPKSNDWVDFYTGQVYQAGTNQYVATKPESIPTFVRAGSFIPMTKWIKNTEAYNPNNIEIHFYHSETLENQLGSFSYDDGVSTKTIEEDKVSTMFCDYSKSEKSKIFRFEMNVGRGLKFTTDRFMTVDFTIHGLDKKPKKVFYNGIEIKTKYDHKLKKLNIPFIHKIVDVTIELKY